MTEKIDVDFEGISSKVRADDKMLGCLRSAALRRLTFDMSGSRRRRGLGPE